MLKANLASDCSGPLLGNSPQDGSAVGQATRTFTKSAELLDFCTFRFQPQHIYRGKEAGVGVLGADN